MQININSIKYKDIIKSFISHYSTNPINSHSFQYVPSVSPVLV